MRKDEKIVQAAFRDASGAVCGTGPFHNLDELPADFCIQDEGFIADDGNFLTREEATQALHADHLIQSQELGLEKALSDYTFEGPTLDGGLFHIKAKHGGKTVGGLSYRANAVSEPAHKHFGYHRVDQAEVSMAHQRQGLNGRMLQLAAMHVKHQLGSKGLVSEGQWRSEAATGAWNKLAQKLPVQKLRGVEAGAPDFRMSEKPLNAVAAKAPAGTNEWGSSHRNSSSIAHHAAKLMGIEGYGEVAADPKTIARHAKLAHHYLSNIAQNRSPEALYHGFQNTKGTEHKVGDGIHLPLVATSGSKVTSAGYGMRSDVNDQVGEPTVYEFPVGTPMHGYNKNNASDAKALGHQWAEALTAGKFKVSAIRREQSDSWQHNRLSGEPKHPTYKVVTLHPHEVFHPEKGWTPFGGPVAKAEVDAPKLLDVTDIKHQDHEFRLAFATWLLAGGKLGKGEDVSGILLHNNLVDSLDQADHEVAGQMAGFEPHRTAEFTAASFMSHGYSPSKADLRAALVAYEHDFEMAALFAFNLPRTEANREILRVVMGVQNLAKTQSEFLSIPHTVEAGVADADKTAQAVKRAFAAHAVYPVKLTGKHSNGTLIAVDPLKRHRYLLKPGSGPVSPAAGVAEEMATQSQREVAFSKVAALLSLGESVPHADLVRIDGHDTAAIDLLDPDYKNLNERRKEPGFSVQAIFDPYRLDGTLYRWAALDFMLGNIDRHVGNVMVDSDLDVKLIDHGSAMSGFAFNPAHDARAFIPCYLRAWSKENFATLTPPERFEKMPLPSPHASEVFSAWTDSIVPDRIRAILHNYGILQDAIISRVEALKALKPEERLSWLLSFWAGQYGTS